MGLKDLLKQFEGEKLKPYPDTKGIMTIASGWNLEANPLPEDIQAYLDEHGEITPDMSDRLLNSSILDAVSHLREIFKNTFDEFTDQRQWALISIMFAGVGTFKKFNQMIKAIKAGDWEKAAGESLDSLRAEQVGKKPGQRAYIEAEMLRHG